MSPESDDRSQEMTERQSVLIVDDRPRNLFVLAQTLAPLEIGLVQAANGNEALAATLDHDFALAILDVQMPEMDGFELAELLRGDERTRHVPIIFLTAAEDSEEKLLRSYEAGGVDFIVKPYRPEILLAKVRIFLELDRRRRELLIHRGLLEERVRQRTGELEHVLEALRESETQFRTFFECAPASCFMVGPEGKVLAANELALKQLGRPAGELVGAPVLELFAPESTEGARAILEMTRLGGPTCDEELNLLTRLGDCREVLVSAKAIRDDRGSCQRTILVMQDITERKRALAERLKLEQQFHASQKLEAVGRLAGGVAHDFNNILTVIIGGCDFLKGLLPANEPAYLEVVQILRAASRASSLTRQLLAFSRKQVLQPSLLDLNAVVQDLEEMLGRLIGENIEIVKAPAPSLERVMADPGQLEQVLLNLAVNARDAMPEGGKLRFETCNVQLDDEFVRENPGASRGPHVLLAVSDTGCGMDSRTQALIFEPFFTTKAPGKGTGLGLASVYGIVKQSNGYIRVQSEVGKGARFEVYLPAVEAAGRQATPHRTVQAVRGGSETILLVEDEPSLRVLARRILKQLGYTVLEASGFESAVHLAMSAVRLDLVLTDVIMPGRDGAQVAAAVQVLHPSAKILYMSGYTDDVIGDLGVLEPGTALLSKPFSADGLARLVRLTLDGDCPRVSESCEEAPGA